jgi:polysaccharide biosynthesis protein PslG
MPAAGHKHASQQEQAKEITDGFFAAACTGYIGPVFIYSIRDRGVLPESSSAAHFCSGLTNDFQPKYTAWVLVNATWV